jgi:hypothetical protein
MIGQPPIGARKGNYTKRSARWDQFTTDEQIIEEYRKMPFVRHLSKTLHVNRSRITQVVRAAGIEA